MAQENGQVRLEFRKLLRAHVEEAQRFLATHERTTVEQLNSFHTKRATLNAWALGHGLAQDEIAQISAEVVNELDA